MPGGRPSKILSEVDGKPITEAIVELIAAGAYPTNAARACGISESTLSNWLAQGKEWEDADPADYPPERAETIGAYVEFLGEATRAEAKGLVWHEVNVRKVAGGGDGDGRLSLEFLARRQPKVYSKRIEVKQDPTDRRPSGIDAELAGRVEETFLAAALPDDLSPDDFLPSLDDAEAGAEAEAPA